MNAINVAVMLWALGGFLGSVTHHGLPDEDLETVAQGAIPPSTTDEWVGKRVDRVVDAWGPPANTKRDGKGGKILVYKILIFDGTVTISDSSIEIAPSLGSPGGPPATTGPVGPVTVELPPEARGLVRGKQKAKFYIDANGVVYRAEIAPPKYKKNFGPE
jgi:hypothetical protein